MDVKLLFFLFSISSLPLALVYLFFPWEIPYLQYFFFTLIFVVRVIFFREKEYKKRLKKTAKNELHKKKGKIPSETQVLGLIEKKLEARDTSFLIAIVLVFVVLVFFSKL